MHDVKWIGYKIVQLIKQLASASSLKIPNDTKCMKLNNPYAC